MSFSQDMIATIREFQELANKALEQYKIDDNATVTIAKIRTDKDLTDSGKNKKIEELRKIKNDVQRELSNIENSAKTKENELEQIYTVYAECIEYSEEFRQVKELIEATRPNSKEVESLALRYKENYTVNRLLLAYVDGTDWGNNAKQVTKSNIILAGGRNRIQTIQAYTRELKTINHYAFFTRRSSHDKINTIKSYIPQYQILIDNAEKETF